MTYPSNIYALAEPDHALTRDDRFNYAVEPAMSAQERLEARLDARTSAILDVECERRHSSAAVARDSRGHASQLGAECQPPPRTRQARHRAWLQRPENCGE
jgi:hypothetical protein